MMMMDDDNQSMSKLQFGSDILKSHQKPI